MPASISELETLHLRLDVSQVELMVVERKTGEGFVVPPSTVGRVKDGHPKIFGVGTIPHLRMFGRMTSFTHCLVTSFTLSR